MAANEYYNARVDPRSPASPDHQAYNSGYVGASSHASPPTYSSSNNTSQQQQQQQQHLAAASSSYDPLSPSLGPSPLAASPFDTVFDDHAYPAGGGGRVGLHQTPASSTQHLSSSQHDQVHHDGQDTSYHSLRRDSAEDMAYNHPTDDIPLQSQSRGGAFKDPDPEMNDHVYDAPEPRGRGKKKPKKGHVRFGELGMLGARSTRIPWVVYLFSIVQVAVFIGEIAKNATLTGSPIEIQPSFNPMIGPSSYVLINMGSRFVACMHNVEGIQSSTQVINWPCPNTTTSDPTAASNKCTLSELCGFGGVPEPKYDGDANQKPEPNQWFRFIIPIFLHAGIIHIGFNLLMQLTLGKEMERAIGSIRFFLVYMSAGIFGFVMGGNFAATGISSTGASGSLFGIIALNLLDLLYSWKDRRSPVKDLMFILLDIIVSFVLGLLPGLDNFSHIGGFLMGLALGITVLHSPNSLRRRIGEAPPYSSVNGRAVANDGAAPAFHKNPVGFFKGRKPLWWAWWLLRAGALVAIVVVFILLLNNFYVDHKTCSWCKYLSCLNINNWCEIGNLQLSNSSKRDIIMGGLSDMAKLPAA